MTSTTMDAIEFDEPGGPEVLNLAMRDMPEPGPGEVLIAVKAAGVNRPDVMQRQGLYPPPEGASDILGLEVAGEVVATGPDAERYAKGDKVCALVSGGGYATHCIAREDVALPVPKGLTMVEAAALPETAFTVWHNVFERGRLRNGQWLLVHGGTSGIGTTAIQLATALGAKVIATAGSAKKCTACEKLGAIRAINYHDEDFVSVVKDETGGHGADVILDMVGGDYIARNLKTAASDGRIVQIAFLQGSKVEVDLMRLMLKRITLTGSTLRARSDEVKAEIAKCVEEVVWPLVAAGKVRPVIDHTFPLEQAGDAHAYMEAGSHIGKIVLTV